MPSLPKFLQNSYRETADTKPKSTRYRLASVATHCAFGLWTAWSGLVLWVHKPFGMATYPAMALLLSAYGLSLHPSYRSARIVLAVGLGAISAWLLLSAPSNDRAWQDDVARQLNYDKAGDVITIHNVRNFEWVSEFNYKPHWESRQYDLSKLETLDVIISIWDNDNIAHTLLSFGFGDGQYLTFSVEIRKEIGESFSSLGGFVRQYEMTVIAADEKDIIYTRSNARDERVYLYPLRYPKHKIRQLFIALLEQARTLSAEPAWYNTLTANCTTAIFELVRQIDPVPMDYRILLSGRLPEYLYELGVIDNRLSFEEWRQRALINTKVSSTPEQLTMAASLSSSQFSKLIRSDLPTRQELATMPQVTTANDDQQGEK